TIDPRRLVEVGFEGEFTAPTDALHRVLTFNKAQSADDVEATESARSIAAYLQSRGYFDVRVTWRREQFQDAGLDHIIYRISQGRARSVQEVTFVGSLALDADPQDARQKLLDVIVTKP